MERKEGGQNNAGERTGENPKIPNASAKKDDSSLWPDIEEMRRTGRVPRRIQFFKADAF